MRQAKVDHSLPLGRGFKQSDAPARPAALRPPHPAGARLPRAPSGRRQASSLPATSASPSPIVFALVADHLPQGRLEVQAATALAAPDAGRGVEGVQRLGR